MKTDLHVEDLKLSDDLKTLPMIAMYDEALKTLLAQAFAGSVILAPSDRAFELFIGQQKDKVKFPFISLFPTQGYTETSKNWVQTHVGYPASRKAVIYNDDTLKKEGQSAVMQNFYQLMYFQIPYVISCWSSNRIQALQLVQELMFWLKAQSEVVIQYRSKMYKANFQIDDSITDSSQYTAYTEQGNIYRFDIVVAIDGPVMRTQNYLNITEVNFKLDLKEEVK